MIRADMIPDEVVEALQRAHGFHISPQALATALNAWPGMSKEWREHVTFTSQYGERRLYAVLPLPQKDVHNAEPEEA